jgi:hypothetical protein
MFEDIFTPFSDSTVYFLMGAIGTLLFFIKMLLMVMGVDGGMDFDIDADVGGHGAGLGIFSLVSILCFLMGAGWVGLACREELEFGSLLSGVLAAAFGSGMMGLSAFGMYQMRRVESQGNYKVEECVGVIGRVYARIPAKGEGSGQVQIAVGGGQKTLPAVSAGDGIDSYASVKVTEVRDDGVLIVEPVG